MRIALTGGIACGKSLVAKFLNEFGIKTIDADYIVHELIPDPAERKRIAAEVFADPEKRRALEARLHPQVKARIDSWLGEVKSKSEKVKSADVQTFSLFTFPFSLRVAIIPLLFEAHWEENFDIICCVRSARATQVARMMETRGYTREEAEARLKAQMPVEEKAAKSHYVINNNGSAEELKSEVKRFASWLMNSTCSQGR